MSGGLVFAAATAVLVNVLENKLIEREVAAGIGAATVTALAPDRRMVGADEQSGLNLFLYRMSTDTRWRRESAQVQHASRKVTPPLALTLHYLLTAYGEGEYEAEILLGHAMHAFHECACLDSAAIDAVLAPGADSAGHLSPTRAALSAYDRTGLRQLTVSPEFLSMEEMSRLWSSLQAPYRPSMTYEVSAVLIGVQR